MAVPKKNLKAYLVGTGEFRFSRGAKSPADAKLKGFRDVGNIVAFTPETENKVEEHEGSYRGRRIVDKKYSSSEKLEYLLTQDEWKRSNLKFLFMADDGVDHTQSAHTATVGDTMAFTGQISSDPNNWYDVWSGGARVRSLTQLLIAREAQVAVTVSSSTNLFTQTGHSRLAGDAVVLTDGTPPTPLVNGTIYYVVAVATDVFGLALTPGGATIDLTTAGTGVKLQWVLDPASDYEMDLELGCVRFLSNQASSLYPIITAPAIVEGDDGFFYGLNPLQLPVVEGYGRLLIFDEDDKNEVVMDHVDFSCTVTAEKSNAIDGKKTSEFNVRVTVTQDAGNLLVRGSNDEPTEE